MSNNLLPEMAIPNSKRTEDWYVKAGDYYIDASGNYSTSRYDLEQLYRAYSGEVEFEDFKYILNPFSTENTKFTKFPAKFRNYNIIAPVINSFLGDMGVRRDTTSVLSTDDNILSRREEAQKEYMKEYLAQTYINELNAAGYDTGKDSREMQSVNKYLADFDENYIDAKAVEGQNAYEYMKHHLNLKDVYQRAFFHWLITGQVFTEKMIVNNDVVTKIIDPRDVYPFSVPASGKVEDAQAVVICERVPINYIVSVWGNKEKDEDGKESDRKGRPGLSKDQINYLQEKAGDVFWGSSFRNYRNWSTNRREEYINDEGFVDLFKVYFISYRKVGYLTYENVFGDIKEIEVDESYKMDKEKGDLNLVWEWKPQWEYYYRAHDSIILEYGVGAAQRNDVAGVSKCPLPVSGRLYQNTLTKITSPVKDGLPFQALYNVMHYLFEKTLAKYRDQIAIMPLSLIPNDKGWDTDKFMYFADAHGFAFVDDTTENFTTAINGVKLLSSQLQQYAAGMRDLMLAIRDEYWDTVGMNRQRFGDTYASDGKGTNEQAVYRSSLQTYELFRQFDEFKADDIQGLIDMSKLAWKNGKRGFYINNSGRQAILDLDEGYTETAHQVFVEVSSEVHEQLEELKKLLYPAAQNGENLALAADVITAGSIPKIKKLIKDYEKIKREFEEQQAEADRQAQQEAQDKEIQDKETQRAHERGMNTENNQTKLQIADKVANTNLATAQANSGDDITIDELLADDEASRKASSDARARFDKQDASNANERRNNANNRSAERNKDKDVIIAKENKNYKDK